VWAREGERQKRVGCRRCRGCRQRRADAFGEILIDAGGRRHLHAVAFIRNLIDAVAKPDSDIQIRPDLPGVLHVGFVFFVGKRADDGGSESVGRSVDVVVVGSAVGVQDAEHGAEGVGGEGAF
jgi:hypothetical protein